jgi:hypothetical protein
MIILLEKYCAHMPCSLNAFILQLLLVPLVYYGAIHKDCSDEPLLDDCTTHAVLTSPRPCVFAGAQILVC